MIHPCQSCGACCSSFRVSFPWGETLPDSFAVPEKLTVPLNGFYSCMKGSEIAPYRCGSLRGEVGNSVVCMIYTNRSSTCRNFLASFENGLQNLDCDRAREKFGLQPLTIDAWPLK